MPWRCAGLKPASAGRWRRASTSAGAGGHQIDHLRREQPAQGFGQQPPARLRGQRRILRQHLGAPACHQRHLLQLRQGDEPGAHAVVDVVRVVGHLVDQVDELRLQAGLGAVQETLRRATGFGGSQPLGISSRTMLEDAFARLEREVQPVEGRVADFQRVHHAQALQVVLEAAMVAHAFVQRVLAGVAEGRVAQVVRQRDGLHQVFVQVQRARRRSRQLRHLQRMREPRAEQVALVVDEDLRLVDQAPERRGVDDTVAVALVLVARRRRRFGDAAPARAARVAGPGGQGLEVHAFIGFRWRRAVRCAVRLSAAPVRRARSGPRHGQWLR